MRFFKLGLLLCANCLFAEPLEPEETVKMIKTFLDYHVEKKALDEPLYEKLSKNFKNLFDPEKVYLIEDDFDKEVIGLRIVEKNIDTLDKGKFDVWQKEFYAFKHSILRARGLRDEIYRQLLLELQLEKSSFAQNQLLYARDLLELKERWIKKLVRFVTSEFKHAKIKAPTIEQKKRAFELFEKKVYRQEEKFLGKDRHAAVYEHFLKAFAKALDAHSCYFTKDEGHELRKSLEKQYEGIGVTLKEGILGVEVIDLSAGGPADQAGLSKGDFLISVDQRNVLDLKYEEILKALEGPRGSLVTLVLRRGGTEGRLYTAQVKRQVVVLADGRLKVDSVPFGTGQIGLIRLSSFYDNKAGASAEIDMKEAISHLKKKKELYGLILDLRNNSGGFLSQAVKVTGLFIKAGLVAVSRYAHGRVAYLRDLDPSRYFEGPLIVLTSKASASAAEVVAQALQDYGRALIVGDLESYGKGSIQYQNVTESDAKHYFKVTVGRYFTVSGRTTQIEGVKADIHVPSQYHQFNIGERFLDNPLSSDRIAPHYIDPLLDIEESKKGWFQKNYLPFLQAKEVFWAQRLGALRKASYYRIQNNAIYQKFLTQPLGGHNPHEGDPPLTEAVAILKDALILD